MNKLITALTECEVLLREVKSTHWSDKLKNKIQRLETDGPTNFHMQTILRWYGFMGAFDDLYICLSNGNDVTEDETYDVNDKLDKFIKTIHAEATRLK